MKRPVLLMLVFLLIAVAPLAAQDNTTGSKKSEKPAVDCSAVDDAAITSDVKQRLAKAPSLKDAAIEVETREGVVTLKGMVKTGGLKGVATRMARRADCVKKVDNQLAVEQSGKTDKKSSDK